MFMYTTLQKWGNSGAVRIPKAVLEALYLRENDKIEIITEKNQIVLRPAAKKSAGLEEIFADWDGGTPEPYDWDALDAPVGREMI